MVRLNDVPKAAGGGSVVEEPVQEPSRVGVGLDHVPLASAHGHKAS